MEYIDGSAPLSEQEVEDLNDLPSGSVPVKTEGGFGQATLANVPDSTAGDGRKAVTTTEKTAVAALTGQYGAGSTNLVSPEAAAAAEGIADGSSALGSLFCPSQVACPAFTNGEASIALASTKSTECVVEATRTLAAPSTLTLLTTDAVAGELYAVTCNALTLGQTLTVVSDGVTLGTFAATLAKKKSLRLFFDGVSYYFDSWAWGQ